MIGWSLLFSRWDKNELIRKLLGLISLVVGNLGLKYRNIGTVINKDCRLLKDFSIKFG
jgi:hypothetical protein